MLARVIFAVMTLTGAPASGHAPDQNTHDEQPAPPASPDQVASIRTALQRHYHDSAFAERVTLRATSGENERSSTVMIRWRPRRDGTSALLRLDLGSLILYADEARLVAAHAANPSVCYEHPLPGGLSTAALAELLPPIPLPQLGWALQPPAENGTTLNVAGFGGAIVTTVSTSPTAPLTTLEFQQPSPISSLSLRHGVDTLAMHSLAGVWDEGGSTVIELSAVPIEAGDPALWAIDSSSRSRVGSIADLRPLQGEAVVGDPCPAIGLITRDIEGWSFTDAVKRLSGLNPQPSGPVWIVLLVRTPAPDEQPIVHDARLRLQALATEFDVQRMQGARNAPRVEVHDVIVLELGQVNRASIDEALKSSQAPDATVPLFSTTGKATFERIAPKARSAVIVLDQAHRLAGVVRLDDRMVDGETIREEVRRIISTPLAEAPVEGGGESGGG